MIYRFNAVKLLDYMDQLSDLKRSDNPFAIITLVHLTAKRTKNHPDERFQEKKNITRSLYKQGLSRQKIIDLYRFIDGILSLPEKLDALFWEDLSRFEESQKMPYVTSVERIGIRKGEQIGEAKILTRLLQRRFGIVPEWASEKIAKAEPSSLEEWADRVLDTPTLDEIFADKL